MNKLDAIRAREQAATPASTGAWRINDDPGERPFLFAVPTMDDIVFIGHSRDDMPLLLAVAEAAVEVLQKFREIDADATSVDDCRKRLECSRGWAVALLKQKLAIAPLMEVKE